MPKAKPKTNTLRSVKTSEVSLVDSGAVMRTFCLRKNEGGMLDDVIKACLETELEDEAAIDARLAKAGTGEKAAAAIKGALRLLAAFKDEISGDDLKALQDLASGTAAAPPADGAGAGTVAAEDKKTDDSASKAAGASDDAAKKKNGEEKPMPSELSPAAKAQIDAVEKANKAQQEKIEALQKALAEREDAEKTRECIAKAEREYPNLGPAQQLGPVLKKLEQAGLYKDIEGLLRGANERAKASALFKEFGKPGTFGRTEGDDPEAQLNKVAADIATKENIPIWKAHMKACEQHPDWYDAQDKSRKVS